MMFGIEINDAAEKIIRNYLSRAANCDPEAVTARQMAHLLHTFLLEGFESGIIGDLWKNDDEAEVFVVGM